MENNMTILPIYYEILDYLKEHDMPAYKFGMESCGNTNLVKNLSEGKTIMVGTLDKIRAYLDGGGK